MTLSQLYVHAAQADADAQASSLISIALLVVSVVFAIAGQLTLKIAMQRFGRIGRGEVSTPRHTIVRGLKEPRLWAGMTLFGISAVFWIVVLSRIPLSVAYPFVGVSYVLIVAMSRFLLHEDVPPLRWVGVIVVATGIAIVGLSFERASGL